MRLTLRTLHMYCDEEGECLLWKLGTNSTGYPIAYLDGRPQLVRRYVLQVLMGKKLDARQPVASRCGHRLCVSPRCLHRTSVSDILRHSYGNGDRSRQVEYMSRLQRSIAEGMAKITLEQALHLRALPPTVTHAEAGRQVGLGPSAAAAVRQGRSWRLSANASSVFAWRPQ